MGHHPGNRGTQGQRGKKEDNSIKYGSKGKLDKYRTVSTRTSWNFPRLIHNKQAKLHKHQEKSPMVIDAQ